MKNVVFVLCIMAVFLIKPKAQGIEFFHGSWQEALAKAKAEDKLLFVDAFAKWCGPCKAMAKNVFTQQKVGDFFNANFINLKLDMEEADGVTFGHKYPVSAYPTLFFLDGDGKVIRNIKGGQQPDGLISHGAEAIKKNDKSGKFEEKYNAGDRSYDLVFGYVKALNAAGKPSLKVSNDYLYSNPAISDEQRLKFIMEAAVDADSRLFDLVITNKEKIIDLMGQQVFDEKCRSACQVSVKKAAEFEMENLLNETIDKAKKTIPNEAEVFAAKSEMLFYKSMNNKQKYISAYKFLAKKSSKNADQLQFIIKDITGSFKENKDMISDAADYAETLFNLKNEMETLNIYCSVLVLNKEVDKAIDVVKKQKDKAEKDGQDVSGYDGLLNYLNSKKA
ncbi:MAG: thioredoxin family protein [Saprospiraceae bacterium]|nr:thioredoxin family protein [Saprospiraceae bacterium]